MVRRSSFISIVLLLSVPVFAQITITDDLGRTVRLPGPARAIVSLAPSITETVCAVGAFRHLAGVTDYCNYPEEVRSKPTVGGVINPNLEVIVAMKPDLVLMTPEGNARESFALLEQLGIPVFVTHPKTIAGVRKSILDIGRLSGTGATAESLVTVMMTEEEQLRRQAGPPRTMMLAVALQPLIVAGGGTFLSEMIELAGGASIAAGSPLSYPSFSREEVLAAQPEVIVLMSGLPGDLGGLFPEWEQLSALRTNSICTIDADLLSRPGPRVIEGVRALQRCLQAAD